MANQHASEKAGLLWTIGPVAVLLTLLFVSVNNNTIGPKSRLMGDHGATVKKEHAVEKSDTTHHEVKDTTTHTGAVVEDPAPAKAPMHK
jgi:hypothetical protein